ncbi:MAG: hypothetical protein V3V23_04690 [Dehalococcoidales bacterium]
MLEILKWVGVVFVAGFIGYFGRYLSMRLIERMRKKKPSATHTAEPAQEISAVQDTGLEESKIKLEKKRAKAETKKAKKAPRKQDEN